MLEFMVKCINLYMYILFNFIYLYIFSNTYCTSLYHNYLPSSQNHHCKVMDWYMIYTFLVVLHHYILSTRTNLSNHRLLWNEKFDSWKQIKAYNMNNKMKGKIYHTAGSVPKFIWRKHRNGCYCRNSIKSGGVKLIAWAETFPPRHAGVLPQVIIGNHSMILTKLNNTCPKCQLWLIVVLSYLSW